MGGEGWGALRLNAPQSPPSKIYNNLLVNNDININFNASSNYYQLMNNISYNPMNNISYNPTKYHAYVYDPLNASTLNNNLYFPDSANGFGKSNLPSMNFSGWKTYTNQDIQGSLISDPGFVSASAPYDFRLTANSPAIDPTLNIQTALGLSNNYLDYDDQFMLWNPDIGPYEYQLTDTDADGVLDMTEICYDGDCSNYDPYNTTTNPSGGDMNANAIDTDGDGTNDGDEITAGTDPLDSTSGATASAVNAPAMGFIGLLLLWFGLAGIGIGFSHTRELYI